ncbi:hypothetical protein SPSYN_00102 [Sporotomaculum syntrophicum]|uniref:Uncharacterized protein n=1 Tax=Sporotomaculum syntrophicum TaxID=182264 RepID=A0A9D3AZY1_9FIRM|nr:hypothetical protein SPSYN_00102 [Sporotomaculum syntrophicum]
MTLINNILTAGCYARTAPEAILELAAKADKQLRIWYNIGIRVVRKEVRSILRCISEYRLNTSKRFGYSLYRKKMESKLRELVKDYLVDLKAMSSI